MPENDLLYRLALSRVPGIGPVYAKKLLDRFGDAKAIFQAGSAALADLEGMGESRINGILRFDQFEMIEKEMSFIENYGIRCLFYTGADYPQRLRCCKDAPILFYYKGNADLNARRIVSIVGTRTPTEYGKQAVEHLIRELAGYEPLIISGLAFGIDTCAHKAALCHSLLTVAVLGHGLDQIYPPQNKPLAAKILKQGGLLTNFHPHEETLPHNFPIRNHVVAALCDAIVVVETDSDGGSMLTAKNALSYKKKIYALPGRLTDKKSRGCNQLIQQGNARLLLHVSQLVAELGWDSTQKPSAKQATLFPSGIENQLSENEKMALRLLQEKTQFSTDELSACMQLTSTQMALTLINLEMKGLIISMPGKRYRLAV